MGMKDFVFVIKYEYLEWKGKDWFINTRLLK
jgi:hypothetical protein